MIRQLFSEKYRIVRHKVAIFGFVVLAAVIAYSTLTVSLAHMTEGFISDKVYHFMAFALLVLPVAALYKRALFWVVPLAILFGGAIEVIQPFVGRQGDVLDFVADTGGVFFGVGLGICIRAMLLRFRRSEPA